MEPLPTAESPRIPNSQQEAQETVLRYLQKTVDGLPPGTVLDSTDFRGGGNVPCDDDYMGPGKPPTEYEYWTHVNGPPGIDPIELIARAGDLWHSWGFEVIERNGFETPNHFGYAPDGYKLHIEAAYPSGYPPTLIVSSPCFPGNIVRDNIPAPKVIRQSPRGA